MSENNSRERVLNALAKLVEAHDEVPSMLTAAEWAEARAALAAAEPAGPPALDVKTALAQTRLSEKLDCAAAMVRLVRELRDHLEENDLLGPHAHERIDNVLFGFLATCPKSVKDEVLHG